MKRKTAKPQAKFTDAERHKRFKAMGEEVGASKDPKSLKRLSSHCETQIIICSAGGTLGGPSVDTELGSIAKHRRRSSKSLLTDASCAPA